MAGEKISKTSDDGKGTPKPAKDGEMPENVTMSVYGARGFYFCMYAGFYTSSILYPNTLSEYVSHSHFFWLALYFAVHGSAMYYFVTAANNPGYLQAQTKTGASDDSTED